MVLDLGLVDTLQTWIRYFLKGVNVVSTDLVAWSNDTEDEKGQNLNK